MLSALFKRSYKQERMDMELWTEWFRCVCCLRKSCSRKRTFLWMTLSLVGLCIRSDIAGVTSFIRASFLKSENYRKLLHLFHTPALNLDKLTKLWVKLVLKLFSPLTFGDYMVLVADGLKVAKEGRKMPAVKSLHQESENNSKPAYIMGHSFQVLGMLVKSPLDQVFSVPLVSRIHEGLVFSNRDKKTLLDKLVSLFLPVASLLEQKAILVADAYYASRKVIKPLLRLDHHLVTRVRCNSVAYHQAAKPTETKRGRPKIYGKKVRIKDLWRKAKTFSTAESPVYGEKHIQLRYLSIDLLWRPIGRTVRFVLVDHPRRGRMILMTTLTSLDPIDVIRVYGYRFKIEVSFKQAIHSLGTYSYHFWMMNMIPVRRKSGKQYLHTKSEKYRGDVKRKIAAYHRYVQLGCIAQGLLQHLSVNFKGSVWNNFKSWLRTMIVGKAPSEMVVAQALRSSLSDFLAVMQGKHTLEKFITENADLDRMPGLRLAM